MPKGVYDRQPNKPYVDNIEEYEPGEFTPTVVEPDPVKMVAMKLLRHYRPADAYEVVGYLKKEVTKKFPDGQIKVVEPEVFIPNEKAPPPFPGVLNENKVWAGTTIKVPEDEGKIMRRQGIAERDFDD